MWPSHLLTSLGRHENRTIAYMLEACAEGGAVLRKETMASQKIM
jgi:hypothetical protein